MSTLVEYKCNQCGSPLAPDGSPFVRCSYCSSVYEVSLGADGRVRFVELERRVSAIEVAHEEYVELNRCKERLTKLHRDLSEDEKSSTGFLIGCIASIPGAIAAFFIAGFLVFGLFREDRSGGLPFRSNAEVARDNGKVMLVLGLGLLGGFAAFVAASGYTERHAVARRKPLLDEIAQTRARIKELSPPEGPPPPRETA